MFRGECTQIEWGDRERRLVLERVRGECGVGNEGVVVVVVVVVVVLGVEFLARGCLLTKSVEISYMLSG